MIPSSHILNEVQEVQPGTDRTAASDGDRPDGTQAPAGGDWRKAAGRGAPAKVQLRAQRSRQGSRPISMPLERLPAPALNADRSLRHGEGGGAAELDPVSETIQEAPEAERPRPGGSSRVSTYQITPFMDAQAMQRRTWDKKYKHYDVTPRTAMIVANLPPTTCGVPVTSPPPALAASTAELPSAAWTKGEDRHGSLKESRSSPNVPLMLRQPRTLQPPPGTFYKPPAAISGKGRPLPTWNSAPSPSSPEQTEPASPPASPRQTRLQAQDSTDSAIDPGVSTSSTASPPQSPPPSSPEDLSPGEAKPVYQRPRSRRLQELEQREAHFV